MAMLIYNSGVLNPGVLFCMPKKKCHLSTLYVRKADRTNHNPKQDLKASAITPAKSKSKTP
jgi:hypothetical protein